MPERPDSQASHCGCGVIHRAELRNSFTHVSIERWILGFGCHLRLRKECILLTEGDIHCRTLFEIVENRAVYVLQREHRKTTRDLFRREPLLSHGNHTVDLHATLANVPCSVAVLNVLLSLLHLGTPLNAL